MDTKDGLVVPVIKDVDKKSLEDLAEELKTTSERARAGKLTLDDMQGRFFNFQFRWHWWDSIYAHRQRSRGCHSWTFKD